MSDVFKLASTREKIVLIMLCIMCISVFVAAFAMIFNAHTIELYSIFAMCFSAVLAMGAAFA